MVRSLTKGPYETIGAASPKFVAKRTAFLLLLASGAGREEIHALDASKCIYLSQDKEMFLQPVTGFIAKNFNVLSRNVILMALKLKNWKKSLYYVW